MHVLSSFNLFNGAFNNQTCVILMLRKPHAKRAMKVCVFLLRDLYGNRDREREECWSSADFCLMAKQK